MTARDERIGEWHEWADDSVRRGRGEATSSAMRILLARSLFCQPLVADRTEIAVSATAMARPQQHEHNTSHEHGDGDPNGNHSSFPPSETTEGPSGVRRSPRSAGSRSESRRLSRLITIT